MADGMKKGRIEKKLGVVSVGIDVVESVCEKRVSAWCEPVEHQVDHGYADERFTGLRERLVVFGQATVTSQPGKGAFHNPAARQYGEAMRFPTPDNLQHPAAELLHPLNELAAVAGVGPDESQPLEAPFEFAQHQLGAVSILDIRCMHHHGQHQAHRVHHHVALAPSQLLGRVVSPRPPFSVVFTVWLSMMAALGVGSPPARCRTCWRKACMTRSQVPSNRQRRT